MSDFDADWVDPGIDENIKSLVDEIDHSKGVETIGSCGGHDNPGPKQQPAGCWFVSFVVYGIEGNEWLKVFSTIADETDGVSIDHDVDGWHSLNGEGCVDPEVVIDKIHLACGPWEAGMIMCNHCKVAHMSVRPMIATKVECPHCGKMTAITQDAALWGRDDVSDEVVQ